MSARISYLLDLFTRERTVKREAETQVEFTGEYVAGFVSEPEPSKLVNALEGFPNRDAVSLSLIIGEGEPTIISSGDLTQIEGQLAPLHNRLQVADKNDEFRILLTITKRAEQGSLTSYSPPAFLTHLKQCSVEDRFSIFDDLLKQTGTISFLCETSIENFGSRSIAFQSEGKPAREVSAIDRVTLLEKRDEVAHFIEGTNYQLVPEDFKLIGDAVNQEWGQLFQVLTNTLALAFTADYTALAGGNQIRFKITGYRTVSGVLPCEELVGPSWSDAFRIYEWTYQGGAISDKAGLLRNVISLYVDDKGSPSYDGRVYGSVCSAFEIYSKRNVGQYIEIKNKLAEFLQNLSKEAVGDADKYTGSLKETLGALMTFFISTIILNAIAGKGLKGIFTTDITYLTYAFLAGGFVYLGLSLLILRRERKTIQANYLRLKDQYSDILDKEDLKRIFQDDKALGAIVQELNRRAVWITVAWLLVLSFFAVVAFKLHRQA